MTARAGRDDSERWRGFVAAAVVASLSGLAVWSLIPFGVWWAGASPESHRVAWQTRAWGTAVVLLLSTLLIVVTRGRAAGWTLAVCERFGRVRARSYVTAVAVLLGVLSVVVCLLVFSGNAGSVDGFAQLFQARIFLSGRTWAPSPEAPAHFATLHMIVGPDRWYSQYPPGQSVLLAAGMRLGAWWIANPLVTAALVAATYRVARWCGGESSARAALALALVSPFLLAMAGSEMNHLAAATLGMLAAASATTFTSTRRWLPAIGVGLAVGIMTAFRPLDAVPAAAVAAVILWTTAPRRMSALALTGVAGALATIPTLAFNAATTGSWRTFGYNALWGPGVSLGFHPVPWGIPLTPARAVGLTAQDFHQLNTYALDIPFPLLMVIAAGYLAGRRWLTVRDGIPVLGALALSGLLFFYWHRDVLFGPRLLFSAFPWYLVLGGRALVLLSRAGRPGRAGTFAIVVAMIVGLIVMMPARFRAYRESNPAFDLHPDRDARAAGLTNAVVVIPDGWGTRLIVRMWAAGISVRNSAGLYASVDACSLEQALEGDEDPGRRSQVVRRLDSLATLGRPGVRTDVTEDVNLRIAPGVPLAPRCLREIGFDRQYGILAFAPFLYLNNPQLDGDIVWARDLGSGNSALFARYPGRRLYRYARAEPDSRPVFTPIDPQSL